MGENIKVPLSDCKLDLLTAARAGDHGLVQQLLSAGTDVDAADGLGMTSLFHAASEGHCEVVRLLLAAGADVHANLQHPLGLTAMHIAVTSDKLGVVQQLLTAGADVEARFGDQNMTVLHAAALTGHADVTKMLLNSGSKVDAADINGSTPLLLASLKGHTKVVQVLLAAGANVEKARHNGCSPLVVSSMGGHLEVVQLLMRYGANPREVLQGTTVLEKAAAKDRQSVVQLLLEAWGQPPITAAALARAARLAKTRASMGTIVQLAKELRKHHPAELTQVVEDWGPGESADAVAAVLEAWASDVNSMGEQQAAVCEREEVVSQDRHELQQLVVRIAGMAKDNLLCSSDMNS